jgi:hypothetical protein
LTGAQDWWGEAPDLPQKVSKAILAVESIASDANQLPSRAQRLVLSIAAGVQRLQLKSGGLPALWGGKPWAAARQRVGSIRYNGGVCDSPCAWLEAIPEPRPTKAGLRSFHARHAFIPSSSSLIRFFSAPVLNRWFCRIRRFSLLAMRPQEAQAIPGGGPAHDLDRQTRPSHTNWLYVGLAAAGITLVSSVAGVLAYDWYFDATLVALSSSLQPFSSAFHQLGGSHLRQPSSPTPAN